MPLEHESDLVDLELLVGGRFAMLDTSDKTKRVQCFVTYEALRNRAAFDGNGQDWMRAWREHRSTIEALASANYDNGKFDGDGRVLVDTKDLTPASSAGFQGPPGS
jgi:Protein of unknown function (DUF1488)